MKKILIIDCGETLDPVKSEFGHCVDWISSIINETTKVQTQVSEVYKGDSINEDDCDGIVITGSAESVYDELPWMLYLESKIVDANRKEIPILGICFGHQVIVKAFGGKVEKHSKGWEIGSATVSLTKAGRESKLFSKIPKEFVAYESHQDTAVFISEKLSIDNV